MTRLLLGLLLLLTGCGVRDIDATYGKRRGSSGAASVNGTAVLAEMFRRTGARVASRSYLSPRARDFDVIVWAPDDFSPPKEEAQKFFEDWLAHGANRTLVYIGRDYDAAPDYWERVQPTAPPNQAIEVQRRLAKARARYDSERAKMPADDDCHWFRVRRDAPRKWIGRRAARPGRIHGTWGEAGEVDPAQLDVTLEGRLERLEKYPPASSLEEAQSEVLLAADDDVLAWRLAGRDWGGGQILVFVNGSLLLNLPLVHKEHRKVAGALIAACATPKRVLFLESGPDGPFVFEREPGEGRARGFEAFTVWPLGAILLHFVALGIVYLATRVKVFGRPRELPQETVSDFGKHITALGELMARTRDARYPSERLAFYREKVKRDSGVSHRDRSPM
jgi:hypothetical protein